MGEQPEGDVVDRQLRNAWLNQLQAEFEDICFQYRINLQPPIIELTDSRSCFGSWNHRYRVLSISAHLIRTQTWQVTLQVLKHEMAHQVCADIFADASCGHGPLFHKACDMLGLSGSFSRAKADCAEGLPALETATSPRTEGGRRVLSRVEKLLALAGSDNEHEAALAMQRAGELLIRHNLTMPSQGDEVYFHLTLSTGRQRMPGYLRGVCTLLQNYFFVRVICASTYDPEKNIRQRTIELFGRPENVAVAEHCYQFLTRNLVALWQENRHRFQGSLQRARNSYFHGVIVGFQKKMAAGKPEQQVTQSGRGKSLSALMVVEDHALQSFIGSRFPKLRKGKRSKVLLHAEAYRDAVATGKTLVLHHGMAHSDKGGDLLE